MSETPIIASIVSAVVVGGLVWYSYTNSFWSDGTPKVYRNEGEKNIIDWRNQSKNATVSNLSEWRKQGGKKKTRKHYK